MVKLAVCSTVGCPCRGVSKNGLQNITPVVSSVWLELWIGSSAHKHASQVLWNSTLHHQKVLLKDFLFDRLPDALEERRVFFANLLKYSKNTPRYKPANDVPVQHWSSSNTPEEYTFENSKQLKLTSGKYMPHNMNTCTFC